jgi:hypothetical protein
MVGSNHKKVSIKFAAEAFVEQMHQQAINGLPAIREAVDMYGGGSEGIEDSHLYAEVFPAVLAIGLQPVRNIWDAATFERVRREVVHLIEGFDHPEMVYFFNLRLDEYLIAWRDADPMTGGNMPWDDVTGGVLSHLGTTRSMMIGDTKVVSPIAIMGVSNVLTELVGMFWKNFEQQFKLS